MYYRKVGENKYRRVKPILVCVILVMIPILLAMLFCIISTIIVLGQP